MLAMTVLSVVRAVVFFQKSPSQIVGYYMMICKIMCRSIKVFEIECTAACPFNQTFGFSY